MALFLFVNFIFNVTLTIFCSFILTFTSGFSLAVLVSPLLFSTFSSFPNKSYIFISYSILLSAFKPSELSTVTSFPCNNWFTSLFFNVEETDVSDQGDRGRD